AQDVVGDLAIVGDIRAFQLHINGRGQAEVKNLGDDIRRQEVEGRAWKVARKGFPQRADVIPGWMMVLFERDEDVSVACADKARGRMLEVHRAIGETDVVEDIV